MLDADGSDGDDSIDIMTDDGEESESDHEEERYQWVHPKTFARKSRNDPTMQELGSLIWISPAARSSIPSKYTGPDQQPQFDASVNVVMGLTLLVEYA